MADLSIFEPEVIKLLEQIRMSQAPPAPTNAVPASLKPSSTTTLPHAPAYLSSAASARPEAPLLGTPTHLASSSRAPTIDVRPTVSPVGFYESHPSVLAARSAFEAAVASGLDRRRADSGLQLGQAGTPEEVKMAKQQPPGVGTPRQQTQQDTTAGLIHEVHVAAARREKSARLPTKPIFSSSGLLSWVLAASTPIAHLPPPSDLLPPATSDRRSGNGSSGAAASITSSPSTSHTAQQQHLLASMGVRRASDIGLASASGAGSAAGLDQPSSAANGAPPQQPSPSPNPNPYTSQYHMILARLGLETGGPLGPLPPPNLPGPPSSSGSHPPPCRLHESGLRLPYKSLSDCRAAMPDMSLQQPQWGLDDLYSEAYADGRTLEGERMIYGAPPDPSRARQFLRRGCPPSLRAPMWAVALDLASLVLRPVEFPPGIGPNGGGAGGSAGAGSRPSSARGAGGPVSAASGLSLTSGPASNGSAMANGASPRRSSFSLVDGRVPTGHSLLPPATAGPGAEPGAAAAGAMSPRAPHAARPRTAAEMAEERGRAALWFQGLLRSVLSRHLLSDNLVVADARRLLDSDQFFIFEVPIITCLLALSRDPSVSWSCVVSPHPSLGGFGRRAECHGLYPPSGVFPFGGLAALIAPICYVYSDASDVFHVFKKIYAELFCRLHTLTAASGPELGLLTLCGTFTRILEEADPELAQHLESLPRAAALHQPQPGLSVPPLQPPLPLGYATGAAAPAAPGAAPDTPPAPPSPGRGPASEVLSGPLDGTPLGLAFPWLVSSFAGHLEVDQVLLLWDRILGAGSLLPVAVAAAGILVFKRDVLMLAVTPVEAREAIRDLGSVNVAAVMQSLLFGLGPGAGAKGTSERAMAPY